MFFHLCEVVQNFQRESIFCNKISSGGSLFIKKLVPGGTNFGGSIFTMTVPLCACMCVRVWMCDMCVCVCVDVSCVVACVCVCVDV